MEKNIVIFPSIQAVKNKDQIPKEALGQMHEAWAVALGNTPSSFLVFSFQTVIAHWPQRHTTCRVHGALSFPHPSGCNHLAVHACQETSVPAGVHVTQQETAEWRESWESNITLRWGLRSLSHITFYFFLMNWGLASITSLFIPQMQSNVGGN